MIAIDPDRLIANLRELAKIGAFQTGVDCIAFSAADIEAGRWLVAKLRQAGLEHPWIEPAPYSATILQKFSFINRNLG